ncbi:helicase-exonuclease AddAB subunit AddA [Streptococcus sp. E24BD]|uniref:helicase-exonuclease AddAB subunit AddA n=1 Tax=Streptococcus sp. E24BD TaxID=3278715 RepID=UPI00359F0A3C
MMREPFLTEAEIARLAEAEQTSDKKQKRTKEQIEAIYSHGQNILVSASAGSGKTFVMVERIIDMLKRGVSIKELFISTFTVKAAGELKERLEDKLTGLIAKTSNPEQLAHLSRQLADVQLADIGTMDAFTQKLVGEYGYLLGLSPKFRILTDKSEQDLLKKEVFDDLFDDYMRGTSASVFKQLVRNFSVNRKDVKAFRQVVDQIVTFVQSTPNPQVWLRESFLPEERSSEEVLSALRQSGLGLLDDLEQFFQAHLRHEAQLFPKAKYLENVQVIVDRLTLVELTVSLEELEEQLQYVVDMAATSNGRGLTNATRKEDTKIIKEVYNANRKDLIEQVKAWLAQLYQTRVVLNYQDGALPLLEVLQDFASDFCQQYLQVKQQERAFEFSDISHFAIRLLSEFDEVREAYRQRYQEVMVDEYQDTNHTQECLLELLSQGNNRFMVGDIKQSIYRFRQADPQIFNQKFKQYQIDSSAGRLILLKENFRSQTEVLEATNAIFTRLMDEEIGDLVYDESHNLVAGSPGQTIANTANRCQYLIYDTDQELDDDDTNTVTQGEVDLVVKEIIALHQSGVPFSDITLLVSSRSRNDGILRTFDRHGIPLVADGGDMSYLQSVDVLVMLDTLRTINNPLHDYALVALLKSPMFSFTEDELARISLQADETERLSFYEKLCLAQQGDGQHPHLILPACRDKLSHFQKYLTKWRQYAKGHRLYDLIWLIYQDRLYYDHVGLLPNGEKRQANLYALALRANQFEKTGFKGLPRFIRMIDRILATDNDLASVELAPPKDAVNLMTIHKSKGLQFAYVFILNMDKVFDQRDERAHLVISRQHGVGIKYIADVSADLATETAPLKQVLVSLDTMAYQANQRELRRASLSEQMRLLYVGMTRAEKKLYLVGKGSPEKLAERYEGQLIDGRLPVAHREKLSSFQDWVLAVAKADKDLPIEVSYVRDEDLTPEKIGHLSSSVADWSSRQQAVRQTDDIKLALERLEDVEILNQRYRSAINLPTVRTPSQIKERYQPILDSQALSVMEQVSKPARFDLPIVGGETVATAQLIGSAVHDLMQRVEMKPSVALEDLKQALDEVPASAQVKAKIDLEKLFGFFDTSLGQLLVTHAAQLIREAPFALLTVDEDSKEEFVVRGIIDGFVRLEDRIILFDYKTDKYSDPSQLVARYRPQMSLYAQALQQVYGNQHIEQYLVLLGGDKVEVVSL